MAKGWLPDLVGALVRVAGIEAVSRRAINFIGGDGVTITAEDNPGSEQTDLTISATGGGGGGPSPSDATPQAIVNTAGSPGASAEYARGDHSHPYTAPPAVESGELEFGSVVESFNLGSFNTSIPMLRTRIGDVVRISGGFECTITGGADGNKYCAFDGFAGLDIDSRCTGSAVISFSGTLTPEWWGGAVMRIDTGQARIAFGRLGGQDSGVAQVFFEFTYIIDT